MFCEKQSRNFFNKRCVYFVGPLEYVIQNLPVPTKRATVILIKVKSRNALCMLLVCICRNQKMSSEVFLFWIPTIRTLYLREQGCDGPWLLPEAKRAPRAKSLENSGLY